MIRAGGLALLLLVLGAALGAACGDGGGPPRPDNGPTPSGASFEELRDTLLQRLDVIGTNIGVVPADVRDELLGTCRELGAFADPDDVEPICSGIEEAIARGDPGRIDLVLEQLARLEPS